MLPGGLDDPGVAQYVGYLPSGSVAAHVLLPDDIHQVHALVHAVDNILEDLLLPCRASGAAEETVPKRLLLSFHYFLSFPQHFGFRGAADPYFPA